MNCKYCPSKIERTNQRYIWCNNCDNININKEFKK